MDPSLVTISCSLNRDLIFSYPASFPYKTAMRNHTRMLLKHRFFFQSTHLQDLGESSEEDDAFGSQPSSVVHGFHHRCCPFRNRTSVKHSDLTKVYKGEPLLQTITAFPNPSWWYSNLPHTVIGTLQILYKPLPCHDRMNSSVVISPYYTLKKISRISIHLI